MAIIVDKETYLSSKSKAVRLVSALPPHSTPNARTHGGAERDHICTCEPVQLQAMSAAAQIARSTGAKKLSCAVIDDSAVRAATS